MKFAGRYSGLTPKDIARRASCAVCVTAFLEQSETEKRFKRQGEALTSVFAGANFTCLDELIVCALAVYGWMPHIPKSLLPESGIRELGKALDRLRSDPKPGLSLPEGFNREPLNFLNNSVVGTSKFLHFVAPNRYAIWDANVARALTGWERDIAASTLNDAERYETYNAGMRLFARTSHQSLRAGEFALFRIGRRIRTEFKGAS